MNLALFDFDGTITTKDSLEEFIIFARGASRYYAGLLYLSPMLLLYKLHVIPNGRAKEIFLAHFFKGLSQKELQHLGEQYAHHEIDKIIRPKALEAIRAHQNSGDSVAVVSASLTLWLEAWCKREQITLIATEADFQEGIFTGHFKGDNCYGKEKARRVNERYDLKAFKTIYAYGDSSGDRELLALADKSFYKPF
jgi:HAD superfamily hydrolase (TIGR01490 family)